MGITYTEKGTGLHDAIVAAGHWLHCINGVWTSDDDSAVQAIIDGYNALPWYQETQIALLEARYASVIAAGRLYSVAGGSDPSQHPYQIDEVAPIDPTTFLPTRRASQDTITSVGAWAGDIILNVPGVAPWPATFAFRDANNAMVPMTADQAYAFTQNVLTYVQKVDANYFGLATAIMTATTQAAVQSVDVTLGWPSNP